MPGKVALIAHGAASTADFVRRVFAAPLGDVGFELATWDRRTPVDEAADEFAALVDETGATVVGGISVGAILATNYLLTMRRDDVTGLLVALPPPKPQPLDDTATEMPSDIPAFIDDVAASAVPWVGAELRAAWTTYDPDALLRELRTAATAAPPTLSQLARIKVPTGIVALADDPVHPLDVAAAWQRAIPTAVLEVLPLDAPATDIAVIGSAAVRALMASQTHGL